MTTISRQHRSRLLLTSLTLFALIIAAVLSWESARESARELSSAQKDLAEAEKMAADIQRLHHAPRIASLELESPDEMSSRVTKAIQELKSATASLVSLDPQQPVRVAKTDYQIRPTEIEIDNVSLPELAVFAETLIRTGRGLDVRDITLSEPSVPNSLTETWLARVTMTQVIYSPK